MSITSADPDLTKLTLLTEPEAAKVLGIHHRTLIRWRKERRIPHCKLGYRTVKFSLADLEAFISKTRVSAKA